MRDYELHHGRTPLLISIPHCGTEVPEAIQATLTPEARALPDTDWHVQRLYGFAAELGASVLAAQYSRFVIDLNRGPEDEPLYPGANNTGIVPATTFSNEPVYRDGCEPTRDAIEERIERYWRPYHAALESELAAIHARHGIAVLYEAHSIRSVVPRFFEGRLPDFNLGPAGGASAAPQLRATAADVITGAAGYEAVVDGRFKGGYITRHYGRPDERVHALQLELSQRTYMDEAPPYRYMPERAAAVQPTLKRLIGTIIGWAEAQ